MIKSLICLAVAIPVGANNEMFVTEETTVAPESFPLVEDECDLNPAIIRERAPLYRLLIDKFFFSEHDNEKSRKFKAESWVDIVDSS